MSTFRVNSYYVTWWSHDIIGRIASGVEDSNNGDLATRNILLFISALIPKALASLMTSLVVALAKPENVHTHSHTYSCYTSLIAVPLELIVFIILIVYPCSDQISWVCSWWCFTWRGCLRMSKNVATISGRKKNMYWSMNINIVLITNLSLSPSLSRVVQ